MPSGWSSLRTQAIAEVFAGISTEFVSSASNTSLPLRRGPTNLANRETQTTASMK
jgi:hypothetical protein